MSVMEARLMVTWIDGARRVVGQVSQGVVSDAMGRMVAVYIAEAIGMPTSNCPRFTCAKSKVESALVEAGVRAYAIM